MMVFCKCQRAPTCRVFGNWPATRLGDTLLSGSIPSAGWSDVQQACYLDYFVGIHLDYVTDCGLVKKDGSLSLWNSRLDPPEALRGRGGRLMRKAGEWRRVDDRARA
jgi:hypothetical protein